MVYKPKHRAETAADRMHQYFDEVKTRNAVKYALYEKDHCVEYPDGMDGFVIHTKACDNYQDLAVSSSRCINFEYHTGIWPSGLSQARYLQESHG